MRKSYDCFCSGTCPQLLARPTTVSTLPHLVRSTLAPSKRLSSLWPHPSSSPCSINGRSSPWSSWASRYVPFSHTVIFRTDRHGTCPKNMISRMYACCSLPWTCSSSGITCTFSPMEYRAATKKRCLGLSSECAKLVRKSRQARACSSNCRVMSSFPVLWRCLLLTARWNSRRIGPQLQAVFQRNKGGKGGYYANAADTTTHSPHICSCIVC